MGHDSFLAACRIFSSTSLSALRVLEGICVQKLFRAGTVIAMAGDALPPVDVVLTGHVRVFRSSIAGREQSFHVLGAGEVLNLVPAFDGDPTSASSVTALTDARIGRIAAPTFRRVVSSEPELALAVLRYMAERLRHVSGLAQELALSTVEARLANFLLSQFSDSDNADLRWTREQIASRIGTVREVVSRTLSEMKSAGLINIERDRIIILDTERLALLSEQ